LLVFEGYKSAWVLGVAACVLLVISSSRVRKRSS
jgi:hypothetical protein